MRWIFGFLWTLATLPAAWADEGSETSDTPPPPEGRWHHVAPESPFYSDEMARLRMAAILQPDGSFARMVLGADDLGAYVTVGLPGLETAPSLRSELVFSNGARVTRTIQDSALDTLPMPGADMMIYSFSVAAEDISAFRRASEWIVTPAGADPVTITLDGSADAIAGARDAPPDIAGDDGSGDEDRPVLTGLPRAAEP
jgi:hypothetical protein